MLLQEKNEISFDEKQSRALKDIEAWLTGFWKGTDKRQVYRLFGVAGSGKTTLAHHLTAGLDGTAHFAAYTGKAALVLQRNGCPDATTIHGLVYKSETGDDGSVVFRLTRSKIAKNARVIVIDECSMVDEAMGHDLLSLGLPILVLGDPAQLPPTRGTGFFTNAKPDTMLIDIHRQARDNPIIRIATDVREGRSLEYGQYGEHVTIDRPGNRSPQDLLDADQVLVGRNQTRRAFNRRLRTHLGFASPFPAIGDRLVCLRNDSDKGILNGELFDVARINGVKKGCLLGLDIARCDDAGRSHIPVVVRPEFFDGDPKTLEWKDLRRTQQFDYGYALTTHKAQGSQWPHVIVYDEGYVFRDHARQWLYTAITRASERLEIIR